MALVDRASMALALVVSINCGGSPVPSRSNESDSEDESDSESEGDGDGDGDGDGESETGEPDCELLGTCKQIDLLFVIDNSPTMAEAQLALANSLPTLFDKLEDLRDGFGHPLFPDVNIMFTTTDVGHPLCTSAPAMGAPQNNACLEHPFLHFEGPFGTTTNAPANDIDAALACLAAQGIDGCGYEAPLEAMRLAIDPTASWNQSNEPFLRPDAVLGIVLVTDEEDCSVRAPEGYAYFTDPMQDTYWEVNPDTGTKTNPTSAVCWNSGVDCGAPDANGVYADCHAIDTGVLHPIDRYLTHLRVDLQKDVVMLGIVGVPGVTGHNSQLPNQPIEGGVADLVYRDWIDSDIVEIGETTMSKQFEFGIGPGCGQAIPPVRIREVCEGLDEQDQIRCCLESVCDTDLSGAFGCLSGMIQTVLVPLDP